MPGIQDLLALTQDGGGGGAPLMPQGGGGGAPPSMGGGIAQVLGRLMQDPNAMKGMMQYAQRAGIDPRMLMQMAQGGGGGMAQGPGNPQAGPPQGPMDQIPPGTPPMNAPPGAPMQPGNEQDMVSQEIDRKGATFDGTDAPTQNDIERLTEDPSAANIKAFDVQFGQGAAEQILEKGQGDQGGDNEQTEPTPDKEAGE
jgi:hypothetical protein